MMVRFARMVTPSTQWAFRAAICCLVLVVGTTCVGRLSAQQDPVLQLAGHIRGTVRDPSGAVIAGAVVTLEAGGSREQRTAITDQAGQFQFSLVNAGAYNITITASGFEVWTEKDVAPNSGENPPVISAMLQVAPSSTQVNVTVPPQELAVEQVEIPLRSTQVRDNGSPVAYHRLENSGRIVIVLYVDKDVILAPAQ